MKNSLKLGLLVIIIGIFATGCFGCGDGANTVQKPVKDSDTVARHIDTAKKAGIDTTKKDTTKK